MRCLSSALALSLFSALVSASTLVAAERFVSTTGNDSSTSGSLQSPFATLVRAVAASAEHDTITIRSGTYAGCGRIDKAWLLIRGYPGERPHLTTPYDGTENVTLRFWYTAHHGTLRNLEVSGGYYCVMFLSEWGYGPARAHHGTIEDCVIHTSAYDAIKVTPECDGVTVRRCDISNTGEYYRRDNPTYAGDKNCQGLDDVNADSLLVQDCRFHDIPSQALYFKGGATDCIIERCLIENCEYGPMLGQSTDYAFHDTLANPLGYQAIRGTLRNCLIRNIGDCGVAFECAQDCIANNNTMINCGTRENGVAVRFGLEGSIDLNVSPSRSITPANEHPRFINNVIIKSSPIEDIYSNWMIYARGNGTGFPVLGDSDLVMDHNIYWDAAHPDSLLACERNSPPLSYCNYFGLDAWQAARFHQPDAADRHSLYCDPLLDVNGMPLPGSPCAGTADSLSLPSDDFFGMQRNGPPQIGAFAENSVFKIDIGSATTETCNGYTLCRSGPGRWTLNAPKNLSSLSIFDCRGRSLLTLPAQGKSLAFSMQNLPVAGLYLLAVRASDGSRHFLKLSSAQSF